MVRLLASCIRSSRAAPSTGLVREKEPVPISEGSVGCTPTMALGGRAKEAAPVSVGTRLELKIKNVN